jgi:hypothetical protein
VKVIYSAKIPSTSGRRNKRTGEIEEYLLVVYDTGEASCTCYAYTFRPNTSVQDKFRARCKHLEELFANGNFEGQGPVEAPVPEAPSATLAEPRVPPPPPIRPKPSLWLDDEDDAPRIRR